MHDKDGGRIRYQRRCEVCDKVVAYDDIDKAYDDGDKTVVLTEDDIASLPAETSHEIDVVELVPDDQIDVIRFDRSYFLEPDSNSIKAYVLLRRTLEETERTAIVQFALRQKSRLGALRVQGELLMLQSLPWDDEVREADFDVLEERSRISSKELKMSAQLVTSMSTDFSPGNYSDDYQDQLRKLVKATLQKGASLDTEDTFADSDGDKGGEVIDLMEALRRSVEKNKKPTTRKRTTKKA